MKILLINETLEERGGQERHFFDLVRALNELGHSVKLYAPKEQPNFIKRQLDRFFFDFKTYKELRNKIKAFKPSVIHLHGINRSTLAILWACRDYKTILTSHNTGLICPTIWDVKKDSLQKCGEGIGLRCMDCYKVDDEISADVPIFVGFMYIHFAIREWLIKRVVWQIIAPSHYLKQALEKDYDNVVEIPYFIANSVAKPQHKRIDVLFVGRLNEEKGLEYLLDAMRHTNKKLVVVGHSTVKQISDTKARFVGKVRFDKVKDYYAKARLVVIPSIYQDNFPFVALESLANGVPIIGSDRGGIPELANFTVKPTSYFQMAQLITNLLNDVPLRLKISKLNRLKAKQYSKEKIIKEILETYA